MEKQLLAIAERLRPELKSMSRPDYAEGLYNVTGFLYAAPLALAGLGWLVVATDLALMRAEWLMLSFLFVLLFVFDQLNYFFFIEIAPGTYSDWQASLDTVITWSAVLILGPSALWPAVLYRLIYYARQWRRSASTGWHWSQARNLAFNLAETLTGLIALALYEGMGGVLPLPGLALDSVLPAFFATFAWWLLPALIWVPLLIFLERFRAPIVKAPRGAYIRFWGTALGWPALASPFAILGAGLQAQNGLGGYLFFTFGLLLTSALAHNLSQAVERSQQRFRPGGVCTSRAITGYPFGLGLAAHNI